MSNLARRLITEIEDADRDVRNDHDLAEVVARPVLVALLQELRPREAFTLLEELEDVVLLRRGTL